MPKRKGRIQTNQWRVDCGLCSHVFSGGRGWSFLWRAARARGWRLTREFGWLCPWCGVAAPGTSEVHLQVLDGGK